LDPTETIERAAYDAWPAEEVGDVDGWRLRAMRGVTHRANSVWALDATGDASIGERIDRTEAWYASRHLTPTFQVTGRSRPEGLDGELARRGYRIEAPVSIQAAATSDVLTRTFEVDAVVARELPDAWFELSAYKGRFARVSDIYRGLLLRIGDRARFALATIDGQPAAVGLGVISGGWMGIFSMLTLPSTRRRGAARAILGALAATAREEGAPGLYLQVERENAVAIALYASSSFRELYGYHYRVPGAAPIERHP
jgi:GNAT superfamily N-acetyltransferase